MLARLEIEGDGRTASGQSVMSVTRETGCVVKLAKDIMEQDFAGPAWNIRSGFGST